mmetsp:Transcript_14543/g.41443  ORF Transcript_14543/g.41443 Transcript_14543/m.41443 type:complete len:203 (+) Transcript_14543:1026-1634(+)
MPTKKCLFDSAFLSCAAKPVPPLWRSSTSFGVTFTPSYAPSGLTRASYVFFFITVPVGLITTRVSLFVSWSRSTCEEGEAGAETTKERGQPQTGFPRNGSVLRLTGSMYFFGSSGSLVKWTGKRSFILSFFPEAGQRHSMEGFAAFLSASGVFEGSQKDRMSEAFSLSSLVGASLLVAGAAVEAFGTELKGLDEDRPSWFCL